MSAIQLKMGTFAAVGVGCGPGSRLFRFSWLPRGFGLLLVPLMIFFWEPGAFAGGVNHGIANMDNRAYFGMVVASNSNIREIVFKAGDGTIYAKKNIGSGVHLVFFGVKNGSYCMTRVLFWHMDINLRSYGKAVCFHAANSFIGYIGHYIFSPYNKSHHVVRFDRIEDFEVRMNKRFPGLTNKLHVMDLLDLRVASRAFDTLHMNPVVDNEGRWYAYHMD